MSSKRITEADMSAAYERLALKLRALRSKIAALESELAAAREREARLRAILQPMNHAEIEDVIRPLAGYDKHRTNVRDGACHMLAHLLRRAALAAAPPAPAAACEGCGRLREALGDLGLAVAAFERAIQPPGSLSESLRQGSIEGVRWFLGRLKDADAPPAGEAGQGATDGPV